MSAHSPVALSLAAPGTAERGSGDSRSLSPVPCAPLGSVHPTYFTGAKGYVTLDLHNLQHRYHSSARRRPPHLFHETEGGPEMWETLNGVYAVTLYCDHSHNTRYRLNWAKGEVGFWNIGYSGLLSRRNQCVALAAEMEASIGPFSRRLEATFAGHVSCEDAVERIWHLYESRETAHGLNLEEELSTAEAVTEAVRAAKRATNVPLARALRHGFRDCRLSDVRIPFRARARLIGAMCMMLSAVGFCSRMVWRNMLRAENLPDVDEGLRPTEEDVVHMRVAELRAALKRWCGIDTKGSGRGYLRRTWLIDRLLRGLGYR